MDRAGYLFISVSWHGRVFKSTQYKCPLKWWNNKAEQCTSKCPNYKIVNFEINKLKSKLIECRDKYIISGKPYTAQMLCDCLDMVDYNGSGREWKNIVSEAISSKGLGLSSSLLYKTVTTSLNGFYGNDSFTIDDITTDSMKRYMRFLKDKKVTDNTIRTYFSRIRAVINYAIESDIMVMIIILFIPTVQRPVCRLIFILKKTLGQWPLFMVISCITMVSFYCPTLYLHQKHI